MTFKQRLFIGLDQNADKETKEVLDKLTDSEAVIFARRIDVEIANYNEVSPFTTILELRKYGDSLSYKINFTVTSISSIDVGVNE